MIETSEQIGELAAALCLAQSQYKPVQKSCTAEIRSAKGSYSYKYADLADTIDATKDALAANGLAVSQLPSIEYKSDMAEVTVTTILMHSSGQRIVSRIMLRGPSGRPQEIGSAITYARRYAYQAMIGVAAEDEDGNLAQGHVPNIQKPEKMTLEEAFAQLGVTVKDLMNYKPQLSKEQRTEELRQVYRAIASGQPKQEFFTPSQQTSNATELNKMMENDNVTEG